MSYNYGEVKDRARIATVKKLPRKGTWLPVSVIAYLTGFSQQGIRLFIFQGRIKGIKFDGCSLLGNLEDAKKIEVKPQGRRGKWKK